PLLSPGCSRMRWALVPLMPKEETAVRLGWVVCGQGVVWVASLIAPVVHSTSGVGWVAWSDAGMRPWCMAWIILMTPAAPAAAWVWPMLDWMEPRSAGVVRFWP